MAVTGGDSMRGSPSSPPLPPSPTTSIQKLLLEIHRSLGSPQQGPKEQERPQPPPRGAATARPGRHRPHTTAASRPSPEQRRRFAPSGPVRSTAGSDWLSIPPLLVSHHPIGLASPREERFARALAARCMLGLVVSALTAWRQHASL